MANRRYVRLTTERAGEWVHRINDLVVEFSREPVEGEVTYALVVGIYPTDRRPLADDLAGIRISEEA